MSASLNRAFYSNQPGKPSKSGLKPRTTWFVPATQVRYTRLDSDWYTAEYSRNGEVTATDLVPAGTETSSGWFQRPTRVRFEQRSNGMVEVCCLKDERVVSRDFVEPWAAEELTMDLTADLYGDGVWSQ